MNDADESDTSRQRCLTLDDRPFHPTVDRRCPVSLRWAQAFCLRASREPVLDLFGHRTASESTSRLRTNSGESHHASDTDVMNSGVFARVILVRRWKELRYRFGPQDLVLPRNGVDRKCRGARRIAGADQGARHWRGSLARVAPYLVRLVLVRLVGVQPPSSSLRIITYRPAAPNHRNAASTASMARCMPSWSSGSRSPSSMLALCTRSLRAVCRSKRSLYSEASSSMTEWRST